VRLSDLFSPDDFVGDGTQRASAPSRARAGQSNGKQRKRRSGDVRAGDAVVDLTPAEAAATRASPCGASDSDTSDAAPERYAAVDNEPVAYEGLFGARGDASKDSGERARPRRERKPATALQRALGLLTRREHSRKELARKLVTRGVDAAEVDAAIAKLADAGWQDERRFADSLVRSRASAGYGPHHIRAQLGTHDLPAELRQAALDEFEGDWVEIARDLVARRFARLEDPRQRERKASDFLVRRGFPADVVRAAVRFQQDD
jgi:regulatory protein